MTLSRNKREGGYVGHALGFAVRVHMERKPRPMLAHIEFIARLIQADHHHRLKAARRR